MKKKIVMLLFRTGALLALAVALFLPGGDDALAAPLAQGALPPQPANLNLFHRSGQTFITWTEVPTIFSERYRIYRHNQPITSGNLDQAALLFEIGEGSSRFFSNRYYNDITTQWTYRYKERLVINDFGPELGADQGLLVWTLGAEDLGGGGSGTGYYAVTTVNSAGTENRQNFSSANSFGPVNEAVGDPLPVEIDHSQGPGWHVYIQYMNLREWNPTFHAPNNSNSYYGFSSNHIHVINAAQYAYDYAVYEPSAADCSSQVPSEIPVLLSLHGYRGNNKFFPTTTARSWCAYQIYPVDSGNTWWFGFAKNYNYRQYTGGASPGAGDIVVNYTEQRLLRMIYDLARQPSGPAVDMDRIYVQGHSMGGSGALALALRYGNVFAAADASKAMTNYRTTSTTWINDVTIKWGTQANNLPVILDAPGGWANQLQGYNGTGVWDWQNHQLNAVSRPDDPMAPFGIAHATNDSSISWASQGQPAPGVFNSGRLAWGGIVQGNGHNDSSFVGLPPNLHANGAPAPFANLQAVKGESIPALSNGSLNPPIPPTGSGRYNHSIMWSSSWNSWDGPPQETASSWQISLCAVDPIAAVKTCGSGVNQTVDVTPRRLQVFAPVPGGVYQWENRRVSDNGFVASGTTTADDNGLLTVPNVSISPQGNRLRIFLSGQGPSPTPTGTATASRTPTPTNTSAPVTPTSTRTPTPTNTSGPALPTATRTPTSTNTSAPASPTATRTPTPTNTMFPGTPTFTNTATLTNPPSQTPTRTNTPVPPSPTATSTRTPTPTTVLTQTFTPTAGSGDTGWRSPTAHEVGPRGDRNGLEIDPQEAFTDNGVPAVSIDTGTNTRLTCRANDEDSHRFLNYGFNIPSGATVTGIEVRVDAWADSLVGSPQICVAFSWNGGAGWSEPQTAVLTQTSENTYVLGGPNFRWGWNWNPSYFTDANFRARIVLDASTTDRDFFVDWVAVRVHYR